MPPAPRTNFAPRRWALTTASAARPASGTAGPDRPRPDPSPETLIAQKCPPAGRPALLPTQRPTRGHHIRKENTMQRIPPGAPSTGRRARSDSGVDATTASDTRGPAMSTESPRTATSARWRRIIPAALCAAALGATWTVPAIASAAPREWDIEEYDRCMDYLDQMVMSGNFSADQIRDQADYCCTESGGVLTSAASDCVAPPLEVRPGQVRPGVLPPGGLPTLTPAPATPSPGVMPTLTAVPGTRG